MVVERAGHSGRGREEVKLVCPIVRTVGQREFFVCFDGPDGFDQWPWVRMRGGGPGKGDYAVVEVVIEGIINVSSVAGGGILSIDCQAGICPYVI